MRFSTASTAGEVLDHQFPAGSVQYHPLNLVFSGTGIFVHRADSEVERMSRRCLKPDWPQRSKLLTTCRRLACWQTSPD